MIPRTGERELGTAQITGRRFRHNKYFAPKPLDPLAKDYSKKLKRRTKQVDDGETDGKKFKQNTRNVRSELKTVDQIRKQREIKRKRKAKNARPRRKMKVKK